MKIRFVEGTDISSKLIIAQQKVAMPFTPSHVEAVMPDGRYLGAHYNGGVLERDPGYDQAWLGKELIIDLPSTKEEDNGFYDYLRSTIGKPYDWQAIVGFLVVGHHHSLDHVICSALITGALRAGLWFNWPLAVPWHLVDPRDLLLMISSRVEIPME